MLSLRPRTSGAAILADMPNDADEATPPSALAAADLHRVRIAGLVGVAVIGLYWVLWYAARSVVASNSTRAYYDFENAFPLADAWLGACVLAGLWCLSRRRAAALAWLLMGSGAGVYLFAMDVLYDLENGIYTSGGGGVIEALVNVLTLALSAWFGRWAWQRRDALLHQ